MGGAEETPEIGSGTSRSTGLTPMHWAWLWRPQIYLEGGGQGASTLRPQHFWEK